MFDSKMKLKEAHNVLLSHLTQNTYVIIRDKPQIYIPENGDVSFWFDDLVKMILEKASKIDPEIVDICIKKNIPLFDIKVKK